MSFTTPCFIQKNTPELLKKLADLDYNTNRVFSGANLMYCIYGDVLFYYDDKHPERHAYGNGIDCGVNEKLFLAIAALRDDTDYMQWFTDGAHWYKMADKKLGTDEYLIDGYRCHKATVDELINHFKTKE